MNILLDTHALWWLLEGNDRMPISVVDTIHDIGTIKFVSIVSLWEVAIKISIGKLNFDGGIERFIEIVDDNGFLVLDISPEHIKTVAELPLIHRDPFDRMLIAQAMVEKMAIMTTDANILKYDVKPIW